MNPNLSLIDELTIFCYFVVVMFVGFWFYKRGKRNSIVFMDAGRSLSGVVLGISLFSSWMSSIALIAIPAASFRGNLGFFVTFLSIPLCGIITSRYVLPFFRKRGEIAAYGFLGQRFGPWASVIAVGCYALANLARMSIIIYLVSTTLSSLTGVDGRLIIFLVGSVIIVYCYMGGLSAIIWTDVIQAVLFFIGLFVLFFFLLRATPASLGDLVVTANDYNKFSLGSFQPTFMKATFWVLFLHGLTSNFSGFGVEQCAIQRYMAAKSDHEAKKCIHISAILIFISAGLLFLFGALLFVFYKGTVVPSLNISGNEFVVIRFIKEYIPSGFQGLMIITILSAAMSSIDSELNGIATIFLKNVYEPIFRKVPTEKESMRVLYATSLLVGIVPIFVALFAMGKENLLELWNNLDSIFTPLILGLFLLAWFIRKSARPEAIVGIVLGMLLICWLAFSEDFLGKQSVFSSPFDEMTTFVLGTFSVLFGGWIFVRLMRSKKET